MTRPDLRKDCLRPLDVLILAGGLGTRIREVLGNTPKLLAPIGGRPFLEYLLDWIERFGARRIILCLGCMANTVINYLPHCSHRDLEFVPLVEPEPLGTAGALCFARSVLTSDPVLVMNGDTFVDANLCRLVYDHRSCGADFSMLCASVPCAARFDQVCIDAEGYVEAFLEQSPDQDAPGLINAGIYVCSRAILDRMAATSSRSLEHDFLAQLPPKTIRAVVAEGAFIDIGIPASLAKAASVLSPSANG